MKPIFLEVRERIVEAYERGEHTQGELAEVFGVSERTVRRLWRQWCEQGALAPSKMGGYRPPAIRSEALKRLRQAVQERPDATLAELRKACRVECSLVTVHNTLKRLGYRRKKNAARDRAEQAGHPGQAGVVAQACTGHSSRTLRIHR